MKIHRSPHSLPTFPKGCALTIGNFDGVHVGHKEIISRLVATARDMECPAVLMTFLPSPEEYFLGDSAAPRLSGASARFCMLHDSGLDHLVVLPFNRPLSDTPAEDFVRNILVQQFGVRYRMVGDDFRFGKGRAGNFELLQQLSEQQGYIVEQQPTVEHGGQRISSTRIRQCLAAGDLNQAAALLGRPYALVGRVTYGDQRGRTWGFPTLNLPVPSNPPTTGVFSVRVHGLGDGVNLGVANLGKRPTIGGLKTLLEVHLFGA